VVWQLFRRSASHRPSHVLCHGFKRAGAHAHHGVNACPSPCIPGLVSHHSNSYVETLKGPVWCRLHSLLGPGGDSIMMDLLLTCGIFYRLEGRPGNFYQLSGSSALPKLRPVLTDEGIPITDAKPALTSSDLGFVPAAESPFNRTALLSSTNRTPGAITFVRSRMLYARAALNAKGGVRFGMRHIRKQAVVTSASTRSDTRLRCAEPAFRLRRPPAVGAHNALRVSTPIRTTQRLYLNSRSPRNCHGFQRLYSARKGDITGYVQADFEMGIFLRTDRKMEIARAKTPTGGVCGSYRQTSKAQS
jgi:hypothetical protein